MLTSVALIKAAEIAPQQFGDNETHINMSGMSTS